MKLSDDVSIEQGDCLKLMKSIPDKSIDMILCDLPYEKDMGKWDNIIDLNKLWQEYQRIIKDQCAIVLFSQQPFSSKLLLSNPKWFKYNWIWNKGKSGNIFCAKLYPLIVHEDIMVFSNGTIANGSSKLMKYYPQMEKLDKPNKYKMSSSGKSFQRESHQSVEYTRTHKYPKSIQTFFNGNGQNKKLHPTQKPVELLEYLIKTYTQENEIVLDNTMGVASTGVACINTNRKFIGYELDEKYFEIGKNRLIEALKKKSDYQAIKPLF